MEISREIADVHGVDGPYRQVQLLVVGVSRPQIEFQVQPIEQWFSC